MSPYLALGAGIAFLVYSGAMVAAGYKYEANACSAGDSAHDLAGANQTIAAHVVVEGGIVKQNNANQEAIDGYTKKANADDAAYNAASVQPAATNTAVHGLPAVSATATGIKTPVCEVKSRVYGLTFRQCDKEEDRYISLWNDWTAQAAIK